MMTFTTSSGATYTVHNGRISREQGKTGIFGYGGSVVARPFKWVTEPAVGSRAVYVLDDGEVIYTSLVESIEPTQEHT